jgi:hypothetical protein
VSPAKIWCLKRKQKQRICRDHARATGLESAIFGVTGRHGGTGHSRLPPRITGYSRHFLDADLKSRTLSTALA